MESQLEGGRNLQTRMLGNDHFLSSAIGFGCMGLNHHRGVVKSAKEVNAILDQALDAGYTMFDTAEVYGPYTNEELVGQALKDKRNQLQIATKGGFQIDGLKNWPDSRPETLRKSLESSLKRLQTETIDLYYIHRVDPHVPIEEVAFTMQQFKKEGKIKHWGLSEANGETIRRAHKIEPLTAIQSEYSIWWRDLEKEIFPILEELSIGLVAYSPLGRGYLSGKVTATSIATENDNRKELPRFTEEALEANQKLLDLLTIIAQEKAASLAQIAIAWILAQRPWIIPIPGTTNNERVQENAQATTISFTAEELSKLNQALAAITIVEERYPQSEKERTGK